MPTPDILASTIMDSAAALLNDAAKSNYTYVKQLPYLRIALNELREILELNNSPVTNKVTSTPITITAGITTLGFATTPALPTDLVEVQQLWESPEGEDNWIPVTKKEFIPHYTDGVTINQFLIWAWIENSIKFPEADANIDIKIDYIKTLFTATLDENSIIGVINSDSYLAFRVAGLCAEFVGENKTRADGLNVQAMMATDRILSIDNKGKQAIMTRRRPFRASYKSRGVR